MKYSIPALATVLTCVSNGAVLAQDADLESFFDRNRNLSVEQRLNQNFPATESRAGSFNVYPVLNLGLEASDNVFGDEGNEESDIIAIFRPELSISSNWSRHELTGDVSISRREYMDFSDESVWHYRVGGAGRVDVSYRTNVTGSVNFAALTEPRTGTGTAAESVDPIEFDRLTSAFGLQHVTGRVRVSGEVGFESFDFDDAILPGDIPVDQDFRDYDQTDYSIRGDLAVSPDTAFFIRSAWNERDYSRSPVPALQRDSSGYTIEAGADFDIRAVARGIVAIGYTEQDYDSDIFPTIDGVNVDGQMDWFPTQLTTVSFTGSRSVKESAIPGSGGYFGSEYSIEVNHELRRHVILSAGLSFSEDEYANIDRVDERTGYSAGVTYMISRTIGFEAEFSNIDQDSSGLAGNQDFSVNRFGINLVIKR